VRDSPGERERQEQRRSDRDRQKRCAIQERTHDRTALGFWRRSSDEREGDGKHHKTCRRNCN
jgi:hypothetical protein